MPSDEDYDSDFDNDYNSGRSSEPYYTFFNWRHLNSVDYTCGYYSRPTFTS